MRTSRLLVRLLLASLSLALAGPSLAVAQSDASVPDLPGTLESDPQAGQWLPWIQDLQRTRDEICQARRELVAAEVALANAIRDLYPRGEAKAKLEQDVVDGRKELETLEAQYPDLVEQARQAGTPARVLLDYEDLPSC